MEIELEALIASIFSEPPGEPGTKRISFDTNNLVQLFESLLMIFTNGMKILYGDTQGQVNLESLSDDDINLMNRYFNSIGFKFFFDIYDDTNDNRDKTQKMKYTNLTLNNNSILKDLFIPLLSKDKIYLINFDKI